MSRLLQWTAQMFSVLWIVKSLMKCLSSTEIEDKRKTLTPKSVWYPHASINFAWSTMKSIQNNDYLFIRMSNEYYFGSDWQMAHNVHPIVLAFIKYCVVMSTNQTEMEPNRMEIETQFEYPAKTCRGPRKLAFCKSSAYQYGKKYGQRWNLLKISKVKSAKLKIFSHSNETIKNGKGENYYKIKWDEHRVWLKWKTICIWIESCCRTKLQSEMPWVGHI